MPHVLAPRLLRVHLLPKIGWKLLLLSAACSTVGFGADHRVGDASDPPPKNEIAASIASRLNEKGIEVLKGTKTVVCQIWLCKEWNTVAEFKPTSEVLYPFKPGELLGVIRFPRKASDFRDQDIAPGVYTLRYAQQPVDGAHVGTSPTRDFMLLVQADKDQAPASIETKDLNKRSAEAAGSNHPALLSLQRPTDDDAPIRHNEEHDWWIIRLEGIANDGAKSAKLPVDLLIVGKAPE